MKHWFAVAAFCLAGAASAGDACDRPKNDFDGLYCLGKIYEEADKELNAHYRQLVPLLDSVGKAQLKRSQLAWQQARNGECSRYEGRGFFVNMDCATLTTIQRSQYLQDRIRECRSAGCLNGRL